VFCIRTPFAKSEKNADGVPEQGPEVEAIINIFSDLQPLSVARVLAYSDVNFDSVYVCVTETVDAASYDYR
jgi:hypothetical protein